MMWQNHTNYNVIGWQWKEPFTFVSAPQLDLYKKNCNSIFGE